MSAKEKKTEKSRESRKTITGKDYFERVEGDVYTGDVYIHQHVSPQEEKAQAERQQALEKFTTLLQIADLKTLRSQCKPVDAYLNAMQKRYGMIKIWAMPKPMQAEDLFIRLNLLECPMASRRIQQDLQQETYLGQKSIGEAVGKGRNGLQVVKEHDKLFVLGKPGAGKTTFLKYLVKQAIGGELVNRIPMFVSLLELSESQQSIIDFLAGQFHPYHFPGARNCVELILSSGKALVLFDGLDEVRHQAEGPHPIIRQIQDFTDTYHDCQFVVTCRTAAKFFDFERFTDVEIADFDDEQVRAFIKKWPFSDKEKASQFFLKITGDQNQRLRDVARNPLLLTLLCTVFEENPDLPLKRSEIYKYALNVLLKVWDRSRGINRDSELSLREKERMFSSIAFNTFTHGQYVFPQRQIESMINDYIKAQSSTTAKTLDPEDILKSIVAQHGIFIECSRETYSFAHLTFQEYYTAKYIVEHIPEGRFQGLFQHLYDNHWWQVFLLTAEMLDDADEFFNIFLAAIDGTIQHDDRLCNLLTKAELEAAELQSDATLGEVTPFEKRWAMIWLILDTASYIARTSHLSITLDSTRDRSLAIARAHVSFHDFLILRLTVPSLVQAITCSSESAIAHTIAHAYVNARARAFASIIDSASISDLESALDSVFDDIVAKVRDSACDSVRTNDNVIARASDNTRDSLITHDDYSGFNSNRALANGSASACKSAIELSKQLGLTGLSKALEGVPVPVHDAPKKKWDEFAKALLDILRSHFPIEDYEFTEEQANHVADYLSATELLICCLQNAAVSDLAAIEDRLLRPPLSST